MRRLLPRLAALIAVLVLGACATPRDAVPSVTYVLVRHAEKATDDAKDPSLTDAGRERAQRLAARLHRAPVVAVYASEFRRTQQTAAPTAADHRLDVLRYEAATPASETASRLRTAYASGTVLVVGHSNTVPALARALCNCDIAPTAETEFGRIITVEIRADGRSVVDDRREP